jgi:hypothetical protein
MRSWARATAETLVGRFLQLLRELRVAGMARLELQHARHDGETVLDPMGENLLVRQRRLEAAVLPLALDCHAKYVGGALQKCEVMGCELVLRSAVDLETPNGLPSPCRMTLMAR